MLRVAVDLGTSSTCTAVSIDGRPPQVVVVDGAPLMPSAVYLASDGTLFVGHEADRQAAVDPSRYEPHPKRRIDEPELLLGDTVLPVAHVIEAVIRRALNEARHLAGRAPVGQLVLTHPADWGAARTQTLRHSAHGLATDLVLMPEPVAAAVFHATERTVPQGGCLAVLDLGGGTVDASVVRRAGSGFHVLGTRGDPDFGGADIDQALLEHIGARVAAADPQAWCRLVEGRELADRRRHRVLRQDVRGVKETLSRHSYADVPMPPPFPDGHLTREDLEGLIAAPVQGVVALLASTIADAGLRAEQLVAIFLVGGSSRIPLVSRLVHERLGVLPVTLDQPETVVARGALHAVPATAARPATPPQPAGTKPARAGHAAPNPSGGGPHVVLPARPPARPSGTAGRFQAPTRTRTRWLVASAVLATAGLAVAVTLAALLAGHGRGGGQIAEQHYRFTVPDGWQRGGTGGTGGDANRVDLAPTDPTRWPDRVFVIESELAYDAGANRDRAVDELRAQYDGKRAATTPPPVNGLDPSAAFAGRDVLHYTERVTAGAVDWYVLFGGRYQVSVGCQHDEADPAETERVRAACEEVVSTIAIQPAGR